MEIVPGTISTLIVADDAGSLRLDRYLQEQLPHLSRTFLQKLISDLHVTVDQVKTSKAHKIITAGNIISIDWPAPKPLETTTKDTSALKVKIIAQTADFIIIDKPAGLITHAAHDNSNETTLVDWLLNYFHEIKDVGSPERPGIVHRLDKDTSGIMIIARTSEAHIKISALFKDRKIKKTYVALVHGTPEKKGAIDFRIARHPTENRMTHIAPHGRDALTHYEVTHSFKNHALLKVQPLTGRTHQIRVHCAGIDHPLVGDLMYGRKSSLINRHALHASSLSFSYQGTEYHFEAPMSDDMQQLIFHLQNT